MSSADFVIVVYKNVLGRFGVADVFGLAYWSDKLADQIETRSTLVSIILDLAHTNKGDASFGCAAGLLYNKITVTKTVVIDYALNYGLIDNSVDEAVSNGMAIVRQSRLAALLHPWCWWV